MTREEQIEAGKIWVVYLDGKRDAILFEGTGPACMKWVKENYGTRQYKKGFIRVAKVLWEAEHAE